MGSGNGVSAIKIHEMTGCNVIGVDISEEMVSRAQEKLKPSDRDIEFRVGDAEHLEFADNTFATVLSESVTAFTDKTKSINEYHRVLKDGGYLGLNEVTWISNPSHEIDEYCRRVMGLMAETEDVWLSLLVEAGFKDINSSVNAMNQLKQIRSDFELQSMDFFRIWGRFFNLYLRETEYRKSANRLAWEALHLPKGFNSYYGYGLYVGKK